MSFRWKMTGFVLLFAMYSLVVAMALSPNVAHGQTCVPVPEGVVAWWPFDEASGTQALDVIGNNPGTLAGGVQAAPGMVGGSFLFDGIDDYIVAPDSDLWAFGTSEFTVEFWANFDSAASGNFFHPGDVFICNDEQSGHFNKWIFARDAAELELITSITGVGSSFAPRAPFSGQTAQWYHIALTRRGTTYSIFVDGTLLLSDTNYPNLPNPSAPLLIGRSPETDWEGYMSGRLDEMTIYHRALSQAEIQAIVDAGTAGKCKTLVVRTSVLGAAQIGKPYSQQLEALFGTAPFSWSVVDGTLPPDVTLNANGLLNGTPHADGSFPFTVRVTDSTNATSEKSYTLDVLFALPAPDVRIHKSGTVTVPGRVTDYFILVENVGVVEVAGHSLIEAMEANHFTVVSADPPPDFIGGQVIRWNLPPLAPGAVNLYSYSALLSANVPLGNMVFGPVCETCAACAASERCQEAGLCIGMDNDPRSTCAILNRDCCAECDSVCPPGSSATVTSITQGPHDPNEKLVLAARFIGPDQPLVYPIHFENVGDIEARDVFIRDTLDPNLDSATVEFLTSDGASFDTPTRTVKWDLLNTNLPAGESDNVLFSVRPLPGLASGTEIRNTAAIQFEVFEVFVTNEVVNVIDTTPPKCTMVPLLPEVVTLAFPVSWQATDAIGEVEAVAVFVSTDGGPYEALVQNTTDTTRMFVGEAGRQYDFFCLARDTAGNAEGQVPSAETTTLVNPAICRTAGKSSLVLKDNLKDKQDTLVWKWLKGEATTMGEFGTPTAAAPYSLLVQSAAGMFSTAFLPPGVLWKDVKKAGFKYIDTVGSNGGIVKAMLKPGVGGKAQVAVGGKGVGLALPALAGLTPPVTVRLENAQSGLCWESRYDAPTKATDELWKAEVK